MLGYFFPWTSSVPRSSQFSLRYALEKLSVHFSEQIMTDNVRGQIP